MSTPEPSDRLSSRTGRGPSSSSSSSTTTTTTTTSGKDNAAASSKRRADSNNTNRNKCNGQVMPNHVGSDSSSSTITTTSQNGNAELKRDQKAKSATTVEVNYFQLLYLVLFAVVNLIVVYILFVPLSRRLGLRMIWNLDDLRHTKDILTADTLRQHWPLLLALYASIYIFNQTFIIPASVVMNCLAGATLGVAYGVPLVAILTASGASCSYMLSGLVGRNFIRKHFPNRLAKLEAVISRQGGFQLFCYLVALRVFPFTPNWFLNMSSPIVGIPFYLFYATIVIGLLPFHFVTVKAGLLISTLTSTRDIIEPQTMLQFALVSLITIIPPLVTKHKKVRGWLKLD